MIELDVKHYGPVFAALLAEPRSPGLIFATPNRAAADLLREMTIPAAFAGHEILDRDMAACCLAAVWLYHDYFDESHHISQDIDTPTGSYWHAILHRREPDPGNAKYWFRRVGRHPVFKPLRLEAAELAADHREPEAAMLHQRVEWDPIWFVDFCQEVIDTGTALELLARQIQHAEWWMLFGHCYRHAVKNAMGDG